MMRKLVSVSQAVKALGVTPLTLRLWGETGRLKPDAVTLGGPGKSAKTMRDIQKAAEEAADAS